MRADKAAVAGGQHHGQPALLCVDQLIERALQQRTAVVRTGVGAEADVDDHRLIAADMRQDEVQRVEQVHVEPQTMRLRERAARHAHRHERQGGGCVAAVRRAAGGQREYLSAVRPAAARQRDAQACIGRALGSTRAQGGVDVGAEQFASVADALWALPRRRVRFDALVPVRAHARAAAGIAKLLVQEGNVGIDHRQDRVAPRRRRCELLCCRRRARCGRARFERG